MKRTVMLAAGTVAGFVLLAPGVALATSPSATPPSSPSASPSPTPSEDPDGPGPHASPVGILKDLTVSPAKGKPGDQVKLDFNCATRGNEFGPKVTSAALTVNSTKWSATVKDIKPGKYPVTLTCWGQKSTVTFEVLGKKNQVAKVPAGAPQTGGTEGPADYTGVLAAVGGGLALVAGGVGITAYRRRAARA
ncbi:hypothetical protein [Amycolatopsis decaplanina]|uniref:Gram-positive cocci surface proteins LPxTG domain-containing protein n=1 Tax=Amycolatopsis decaplanina DSM 44594 TaxID=1284240 RepID=M2YRX7_9PSEU|nr:hypothetical protein [Amycolatopsis decaplanina]EME57612.1 hypothetical protein H074_20517 [Amycolatopsis decaplanina DSM 44594]